LPLTVSIIDIIAKIVIANIAGKVEISEVVMSNVEILDTDNG